MTLLHYRSFCGACGGPRIYVLPTVRHVRTAAGDILLVVNDGASRTARWDICWFTIQPVLSSETSRFRGRTSVPMAVPHSRYSYPHREDSELSSVAYILCRTSYLIVVDYRGISRCAIDWWSVKGSVGFIPALKRGFLLDSP